MMQQVVNNDNSYSIQLNGMDICIENINEKIVINITKIDNVKKETSDVVSSTKKNTTSHIRYFKSEHKVLDAFLTDTIFYEYHMHITLIKLYNRYINHITENKLKKYKMSLKKFKQEIDLAGIQSKKNAYGTILLDVSFIDDDLTENKVIDDTNTDAEVKRFCNYLTSDDTVLDDEKESVLEDVDIDEVLDKQAQEPIEEYNYPSRPELSNGFYACGS